MNIMLSNFLNDSNADAHTLKGIQILFSLKYSGVCGWISLLDLFSFEINKYIFGLIHLTEFLSHSLEINTNTQTEPVKTKQYVLVSYSIICSFQFKMYFLNKLDGTISEVFALDNNVW